MRFRKGSRVEVFSYNGAWRSAEIQSGNGHTYIVRYYSFGLSNKEILEERVPRKLIRPFPPRIQVDRCVAGETVEVLVDIFWKAATVLEELSGGYYVVRLLGDETELKVHKFSLRARQSWIDDRWVVIEKVSCSLKSSTLTGSDVQQNLKPLLNNKASEENTVASSRILKRPSPCDWYESAESCTGSPKKIRSNQHRFGSSSAAQRVDAAACCPGGKIRLQASVNNGLHQLVRVRSKKFSECVVGKESLDSSCCYDSDACSVGSCSPNSYDDNGFNQDTESCSSDAESSKEEEEEDDGAVMRSCRPELYRYRNTLGKLFASGPMNWDQEASLTDLRLSLNISNDEHLTELRNLKSVGTHSSKFC
ncbi:unnamed protein product [Cochlearia groenlandica]